jgi:hypothetical protein
VVNSKRLADKLPSLIAGDCSTKNKKGWKIYMRTRYRLTNFKRRCPEKYNAIINKLVNDLNELDKEVNA